MIGYVREGLLNYRLIIRYDGGIMIFSGKRPTERMTPEKIREKNKRSYLKHREERIAQMKKYYYKNYSLSKNKYYDYSKSNGSRRVKIYELIGNGKIACACCGETEIRFITIDHIFGGGKKERRVEKWDWRHLGLKTLEAEKHRFQLLCWNCNSGRQINGGVCPHKEKIITPVTSLEIKK
jgi:hypothetical protein